MSPSVSFPPELVNQIAECAHADESFSETVLRGITAWLELNDGRTEQGVALAVLLDEVGACARGEMPVPQPELLAGWLRLLNRVAGSANQND